MSVLIRLPLNGNVENTGIHLQSVITVSGATVDASGKTGKCYSFDGSDDYISISNLGSYFTGGSNSFSVSFWFYHSGNNRRGVLFGNYGIVSTSEGFNIEITAQNRIRFWWKGNPDWQITAANFTIATLTWYHVVFVYDGSKEYLYIDNVLKETRTGALGTLSSTSNWYLGRDSRTGATAFYGKLNDFRLYDYALSVKEIQEIYNSAFLIAHYPLNDPYLWVLNNLISKITSSNARILVTEDGIKVLTTSGDAYCNITLTSALSTSLQYIMSYWVDMEDGDRCNFGLYYSSSMHDIHTLTPGMNYVTFTPTIALSTLTFDDNNRSNANPIYIRNIKIEPYNGSATPCGSLINKVYDCAGHYDGIVTGQVKVYHDDLRYSYLTAFTGSQYMATSTEYAITPLAISFWLYVTSIPTSSQVVFAEGKSKLAFGFYSSGKYIIGSCGSGANSKPIGTINGKIIAGKMNHIVIQMNGSTIEYWVNGTKLTNSTSTNYWTHNLNTLYIGARNNGSPSVYGNFRISDFRVYSKVLTSDEINNMIHKPESLSKNGTLFALEFDESYNDRNSTTGTKFHSTGKVSMNNITEYTASGKLMQILKDGTVKTAQIIEK